METFIICIAGGLGLALLILGLIAACNFGPADPSLIDFMDGKGKK